MVVVAKLDLCKVGVKIMIGVKSRLFFPIEVIINPSSDVI